MNDNLAIHARNKQGEMVMTITVNLGHKMKDETIIIKDYSENEGVAQCFIDMGFIEPKPVKSYMSGFVTLYEYKLKDEIYKYMKDW
jgi:hypothetical protein